ncbi:MAG: DUF2934 domain-containing protein [Rubrivivax sp.]|nr:DUF2934 domain-containing protein [Rubrivivax sp.]
MSSTARTSTASKARRSATSATPAAPAAKPRRSKAPPSQAKGAGQSARDELPREERVRQLAYAFFELRGGGDGQAMDDWLRAEQAIEADDVQAARSASEGH